MVRFSRSHIRFGTFERFHYLGRTDLIQTLLDHVIEYYYPHLTAQSTQESNGDRYLQFYKELVQRVAELAAQWMSIGFCHAVLNTDNMSITGESFDYGPYAFINQFDPQFTAAYFDYFGRYCYGNQPRVCEWNLQMLQVPLKGVLNPFEMEAALTEFDRHYQTAYREQMLQKLGFELGLDSVTTEVGDELLRLTLQLLWESKVGYHDFFMALRQQFSPDWRDNAQTIFNQAVNEAPPEHSDAVNTSLEQWQQFYHQVLNSLPADEMESIARRLNRHNPTTVIIRPEIEAIWEPIVQDDNWQPFYDLLKQIRECVEDA